MSRVGGGAPPGQQADPGPVGGEAMARANGIDICYQTLGDRGSSAILLIMGLGMQLIAWPDAFCESLVGSGFRVIRFDNRDVGHSTHIDWRQRPRLLLSIARGVLGLPVRSPYQLSDMAADAIALLDAGGRARPPGRCLDGRHDCPVHGGARSGAPAEPDVHHVVERQLARSLRQACRLGATPPPAGEVR